MGKARPATEVAPRSSARRVDPDGVARPHHEADVGDHEGQAQGDEHLRQLGAGEPAQDEPLDDAAEGRDAAARPGAPPARSRSPRAIRLVAK